MGIGLPTPYLELVYSTYRASLTSKYSKNWPHKTGDAIFTYMLHIAGAVAVDNGNDWQLIG